MLRNLTAKTTCEALLQMFSQVGIVSNIICDRGSNFTSALTQEFLRKLGCSPRLLTPNHPQASGLVERFNSTFKQMLAHVVRDHPGTWHKLVPYVVWAIRETPSATTGVSPYEMVYARKPHGILALLKETWSGDIELPPGLTKTAVEYLQEIKESLELVADYADQHSEKRQRSYVNYYNLRARDKSFIVGDEVVVLAPDSTNKVYSRWRRGKVTKVLSPHSYLVELEDGGRRHIHANHMRKFIARAQPVGIMSDDKSFGKICFPPTLVTNNELLPSERIDKSSLEHLSNDQRHQLLLIVNEFSDIFTDKPGLCTALQHEIQTTSEFKPKSFKAYRIPELLKAEVDRQVDQLLEWKFVRPSQSPMSSPIVCALKKDGSVRLAVNFQFLNKFTVPDAFPMPNAEDVKNRVGNATHISCFDTRSGYWQQPMHPDSVWLTAFATHRGSFEWLRSPFGLKNSAAKFCRMIEIVLKPIRHIAEPYVDDMGVHSVGWGQHLQDLVTYFNVIRSANLTLNLKKSSWAKPEVKMVGHYIGSGRHRPDPEKLATFQNLERPKTKAQLRRLLGMMGYYRSYVKGFAQIAKPLTDMTRREVPNVIPWNSEQERAFQTLKQSMCEPPILKTIEFGKPFFVQTDASAISVGCCLGQWDEDGRECPVAYASQKLTDTQQRWPTVEREAYAVIWALQKYRDVIFGAEVTVFVDHNPLTFLTDTAPKSAKLIRWMLAIQDFGVKLRYKRGSQHKVADCLSRLEQL